MSKGTNKVVKVRAYLDGDKEYTRVNMEMFIQDISNTIERLNEEGYEINGIVPIISGIGKIGPNNESGFGYSFTEGVIILGKKFEE